MIQRTYASNLFPQVNSAILVELNVRVERLNNARSQLEGDVCDLEDSLNLNIRASSILLDEALRSPNMNSDRLDKVGRLISQNGQLIRQIREQRQAKQAAVAEALIHDQVLVQEQIFFSQRLASNQQRLDDLRKLMHDKEFSYSNLVDNLNEYEEVPECEFVTTLPNIDYVLHDNNNKKVMSKLSHEKQEMVTERDRQQHEQKQIKRSFRKVVDSIVNGTDYHKIVAMVGEYDEPRSQGHENLLQERRLKPEEQGSPMHLSSMHAPLRSIHRELMILLKKEKNAKELISEELKESFELGSDVKERNQQLQQSNHSLQQQLETYRRQLKSLELKLNYYGSWVRQTEETEVKFEQLVKEPSSSLIEELEQRKNINKRVFHDALLIKCGSEPDCSRDSANNHCSTADFDY